MMEGVFFAQLCGATRSVEGYDVAIVQWRCVLTGVGLCVSARVDLVQCHALQFYGLPVACCIPPTFRLPCLS